MDRDLRVLLVVVKWAKWVFAAGGVIFTWVAVVSTNLVGLWFYQKALIGAAVFCLVMVGLYYFFRLVDRATEGLARFREGHRVATLLEESTTVGHDRITIGGLMNVWLADQPDNETIRAIRKNTILRVLKSAIRQGMIRVIPGQEGISLETFCDQKSATEFFRKRRWLDVKEEKWT